MFPMHSLFFVQIPPRNDEEFVAAHIGGADIFGETQILCNVWLRFASVIVWITYALIPGMALKRVIARKEPDYETTSNSFEIPMCERCNAVVPVAGGICVRL